VCALPREQPTNITNQHNIALERINDADRAEVAVQHLTVELCGGARRSKFKHHTRRMLAGRTHHQTGQNAYPIVCHSHFARSRTSSHASSAQHKASAEQNDLRTQGTGGSVCARACGNTSKSALHQSFIMFPLYTGRRRRCNKTLAPFYYPSTCAHAGRFGWSWGFGRGKQLPQTHARARMHSHAHRLCNPNIARTLTCQYALKPNVFSCVNLYSHV
jgi:hypothetical protein